MILSAVDQEMKTSLMMKLEKLEEYLKGDVMFFFGNIIPAQVGKYRFLLEELQVDKKYDTLYIILNTPGGIVETVERFVNMNRHFYKNVNFIVPDEAMSAGTVFCLSGDKIYMDYSSSLGLIDPQVYSQQQKMFVPALGYLDKVEFFINKSMQGTLTEAEFLLLKDQDLAFLTVCEQQKNLTIKLIKEWLVKYKFKDWVVHSKTNEPVTAIEKEERAEDIAKKLGDNKLWCSHGRCIGINILRDVLNLKIDDYSENYELRNLIREYNTLIIQYIQRFGYQDFFHTRKFF